MQSFDLKNIQKQAGESEERYLEFLRVPSMSVGLYRLPAGGTDLQSPHKQDEVYYVLAGKAKLQGAAESRDAFPGAVLFVEAGAQHKFVDIEEDLELLVFFTPAEQG